MDNKNDFKNWLLSKFSSNSNAGPSYMDALSWLSDRYFENGKIKEKSLFLIEDSNLILELYEEALEVQKDENSYIFNKDAPSYGKNGYFSASLKKYMEFLENTPNQNQTFFLNDFIDWFIGRDGYQHNYFSHSFSRNQDKLKSELLFYESVYKKEFNSDIFTLKSNNLKDEIRKIELNLEQESGKFFEYSKNKSTHMPRAILGKRNYLKFLNEFADSQFLKTVDFDVKSFIENLAYSGLIYSPQLLYRFVSSLLTKPFLILTGLSGSGKTKLAQAFVEWISDNKDQYKIIPVGADWTNREPLLGYPNALNTTEYILPENGALALILKAIDNPQKPYFLILDEMNLSHVERYFADFLSTMESNDQILLHASKEPLIAANQKEIEVPGSIHLPDNLFIIGTVNIDETTHMFSPKVLDRANTVEFRIKAEEMSSYFEQMKPLNMEALRGKGSGMAGSFLETAKTASVDDLSNKATITAPLNTFFIELSKIGAEFGYRTASEIIKLCGNLEKLNKDITDNEKIDIAIMQKLLPKIHGSRRQLSGPLIKLATFCYDQAPGKLEEILADKNFEIDKETCKYPLSLEKIARMYRTAIHNGFASFAEA